MIFDFVITVRSRVLKDSSVAASCFVGSFKKTTIYRSPLDPNLMRGPLLNVTPIIGLKKGFTSVQLNT